MAWSKNRAVTLTEDQWETVTSLMRIAFGEMDASARLFDLHDEIERQVAEQGELRSLLQIETS